MTEHVEIETIRTTISTHLTRTLMLFGRLNPEYNARYLPVTVASVLYLVKELEQIEKRYEGFSDVLSENIERRDKHTGVFVIPQAVADDPCTRGLRKALYELIDPLVGAYCQEEKRFLSDGLGPQVSLLIRSSLLMRTERNCKLLSTLCKAENCLLLEDLRRWCDNSLKMLS